MIHPDYQGAGLGGKLVNRIKPSSRMNRVERVYLMTHTSTTLRRRVTLRTNSTATMVLYSQPTYLCCQAQMLQTQGGRRPKRTLLTLVKMIIGGGSDESYHQLQTPTSTQPQFEPSNTNSSQATSPSLHRTPELASGGFRQTNLPPHSKPR
jgi:hypothetical protein